MDKKQLLEKVIGDLKSLKHPLGSYLFAGGEDYRWLFGRDSLITALMLLPAAQNGPEIARSTIRTLAKLQGKHHNWRSEEQPGKILHEHRDSEWQKQKIPFWEFPYYGSLDATPLFIILAGEYVRKTNRWDFIKEIWPNLEAAANWMKYYGDMDGDYFIECEQLNPRGIRNQCWKDHTPFCHKPEYPVCFVEIQGYAYLAYLYMSEMAAYFNKDWQGYYRNAERLKFNFNQKFWNEERGAFALALDANKEQVHTAASNTGHLFFTGIIDNPEKMRGIAERLCKPDLWTPYGIRTLSDKEPCFNPYLYHLGSIWLMDNWFTYYGLKNATYTHPFARERKFDFREKAKELKKNMLDTACLLGEAPELHACDNGELTTCYGLEGWGTKSANHVQAWSAAAILNLLVEDLSEEERKKILI
ncbi:MAG: hypothetical protein HYS15_03340 [Candidatus Spechtbacteria bacterium]|nr:hypothetical protein [Candidatus Spechtbacteria bacterium]